ncbi:AraC family transcriptional regulator [Xanthovirga aplysinae]|uniref:AraC family transcriptional regulator n=1 Tax=Xanthovirga aplysinae TaxID=2529853 RepID=UPI0012BB70A3|nr:AraC family transcriptional regulator [Xanthovirga aplysinae]MTI32312.1 AraC family transcriptional regulator [Xanthovirga aplysinae]
MSKPLFFKVPDSKEVSFRVQYDDLDYFYSPLHLHPEIQLSLILESEGTSFIGESIRPFSEGDLLLIGPNLPHVFRNDKSYYQKGSEKRARAISIFFKQEAFGPNFFSLPETQKIGTLLSASTRGIEIMGEARNKISYILNHFRDYSNLDRFLQLIKILDIISHSSDLAYLSSYKHQEPLKDVDNQKIEQIFDFVTKNFDQEIRLEEVASLANMSITTFCRFFKQRTQKTFTLFLNEIRIGHACRLLKEEQYNISQICYECGFNNISNFNRKFKEITGHTPKQYRKKFV